MVFNPRHNLEIPFVDILTWVFEKVEDAPSRRVFLDAESPDHSLTARQLLQSTKAIGAGLRSRAGITSGEVVLAYAGNSYLYPSLVLGTLCAGGVFSGANPSFGQAEFLHQLLDSQAKAVFVDPERYSEVRGWMDGTALASVPVFLLSGEVNGKATSLGDLIQQGDTYQWERLETERQTSRTAFLMYSSGTTGKSKGCLVSHRNSVANCMQILFGLVGGKQRLRSQGESWPTHETTAIFAPFFSAVGIQLHILIHVRELNVGYVLRRFSLPLYLSVIQDKKVDVVLIVPPVAVLLAKNPLVRQYDLTSLRVVFCGAAPLGKDLHAQVEKVLSVKQPVHVRQAYGLTEVGLAATYFAMDEWDSKNLTGVGYLVPNVQAKLVNEQGAEVGFGQRGEIYLKGPNVFKGYHNNHAANTATFSDGWFRTGDVGVFEPSGMLYIVDRVKELIKVKGMQVAPAELEDFLLKSEDVADVAVVGVPGEGTELVRAYVVPSREGISASSIESFVSKHLAHYKRLTGGVIFVSAIPKSPSGKILRRFLRDKAKMEVTARL